MSTLVQPKPQPRRLSAAHRDLLRERLVREQVRVAERGAEAWLTMGWHRDLELLDGQFFNVGQYLADEGIEAGA